MRETSPPTCTPCADRGGRRPAWLAPPAPSLIAALAGGCSGAPSALEPRGPRAAQIADLWWLMLAIAAVATVLVVALLLFAVLRWRWRGGARAPRHLREGALGGAARMGLVVVGGIVAPLVALLLVQVF